MFTINSFRLFFVYFTYIIPCCFGLICFGFYICPLYTTYFVWALVGTIMAGGLYEKNTIRICKTKKSLAGQTVLVTGGSAGIGLEVAQDVAHRGARVIIACPFEEEGLSVAKRIRTSSGNDKVFFKILDLASLKSVRQFASEILKEEQRLDILINNAGASRYRRLVTDDGLHELMQVNYFGTFLLTLLLLPLLRKTASKPEPCRIINTASTLHRLGKVDYGSWTSGEYMPGEVMYHDSKLCLVLFSRQLSEMLKSSNIVVNVADPGVAGTGIFYNSLMSAILTVLFKNAWEGAQTTLHCALTSQAGEVTGEYFKNCEVTSLVTKFNDEKILCRFWEESARVVKLSEKEWNY